MVDRVRSRSSASCPERGDVATRAVTDVSVTLGGVWSRGRGIGAGVAVLVALVTAGCGSTPTGSAQTEGSRPGTTTSQVPLPAGRYPSTISKMVCRPEAQREIAEALGVTPVQISTPTWVDDLYSCRYQYSNGVIALSVKELSSWAETLDYFHAQQSRFGNTGSLANLGQGAFSETDGSVVVRKDWKVLIVDTTGLPDQFGVPPTSSRDIAVTVADVILGCWSGD